MHIAGAGDFSLADVTRSYDPCPLEGDIFGTFDRVVEESHSNDWETWTYLRLDVLDIPSEIVENFDPYHPILIGGYPSGKGKFWIYTGNYAFSEFYLLLQSMMSC